MCNVLHSVTISAKQTIFVVGVINLSKYLGVRKISFRLLEALKLKFLYFFHA